ncbi:MAG: lipopolysaccharide heptosyltransferase II [Pseudomonadales bacterium]
MNAILIVGPSWVGDMVMSQTLYIALKKANPDTAIDVLAPAWSEPLLAAMPEVRHAIRMPLGHGQFDLMARRKLGKQLKSAGYQKAFVLPNSWKSALVPWFAGIPIRSGWRGEMRYGLLNDLRLLDKERFPYMIQRYVALADEQGNAPNAIAEISKPALQIDQELLEPLFDKFSINSGATKLGLCPGAEFGPAKRWPEAHYATVAEARIDAGEQVLIFGSNNDEAVANTIVQALPEEKRGACVNLAGKTSLSEAIHAMSLCDRFVTNDSGLMHIAAALGKPLVALYGSTSAGFTPPLGENDTALSIPVDCGPCFERECPLGHMKCLVELKPERVLEAL